MDEEGAQQKLDQIKEMVIHCAWHHIRGCKWCGDICMEWQGVDCENCRVFICDYCNKLYHSHMMSKDHQSGAWHCRDCAYRCCAEGCDESYYHTQTSKLGYCKTCGRRWCKAHLEGHICVLE